MAKSRNALLVTLEDLEAWKRTKIRGFKFATIPYADWHVRVDRLQQDASYVISSLDHLFDRHRKVHSMVLYPPLCAGAYICLIARSLRNNST